MYYIFNTKKEAEDYDKKVSKEKALLSPDNWANPFKHANENKWAIIVNPEFKISGKKSELITQDWYAE